jgi:hypothetical protein
LAVVAMAARGLLQEGMELRAAVADQLFSVDTFQFWAEMLAAGGFKRRLALVVLRRLVVAMVAGVGLQVGMPQLEKRAVCMVLAEVLALFSVAYLVEVVVVVIYMDLVVMVQAAGLAQHLLVEKQGK